MADVISVAAAEAEAAPRTARRVLSVRDLVVDFPQQQGTVRALDGVSLDLHAGRVLGVVARLAGRRDARRQGGQDEGPDLMAGPL